MSNRRNFLVQTTMATTAILAANPLKTFASVTSSLTGFSFNNNSVLLIHTGYKANHLTVEKIKELKYKNANVVLLNTACENQDGLNDVKYDVIANAENILSSATSYTIMYKGNFKIGIIKDINTISEINSIATKLKKGRNCHLVVYLSNLGYKNKNAIDDVTLAKNSTNLDIIIGAHAKNFSQHSIIALNTSGEEVIIDHASHSAFDVGKIEINFDKQGRKKRIDFHNQASV